MIFALAAAVALSWQGTATVYPGGTPLRIAVQTRIDDDGDIVSESWPVEQGPAKGMHRMRLGATGGTAEVGGRSEALPPAVWKEERAQFGFYQQLQEASRDAPRVAAAGANMMSVGGAVRTWFKLAPDGTVAEAFNDLPSDEGRAVRQRFTFDGWWRDGTAVFPKHMEMTRDGAPYFTLDVDKFDAN